MEYSFIKSEIKLLPNFKGSTPHHGGHNVPEYMHWFKQSDDGEFLGLSDDEALDLLNFLNKRCSNNLTDNSIEKIEEDDIPYIVFNPSRAEPVEYDLLKIVDYTSHIDFEVLGYLPANHNSK